MKIWRGREPISTPGRKGAAMGDRELTMAGLLADPMTLALMAADKVDHVEPMAASTTHPRGTPAGARRSSGQSRIDLVNFSQDRIQ
jgi:hypothetical protein